MKYILSFLWKYLFRWFVVFFVFLFGFIFHFSKAILLIIWHFSIPTWEEVSKEDMSDWASSISRIDYEYDKTIPETIKRWINLECTLTHKKYIGDKK